MGYDGLLYLSQDRDSRRLTHPTNSLLITHYSLLITHYSLLIPHPHPTAKAEKLVPLQSVSNL
jgi:hypothetical protein